MERMNMRCSNFEGRHFVYIGWLLCLGITINSYTITVFMLIINMLKDLGEAVFTPFFTPLKLQGSNLIIFRFFLKQGLGLTLLLWLPLVAFQASASRQQI